jgi:hypothetical protein
MKRRTYQNVFLRVPQPRFGVEKTVDAGSQTGRRRRRRCSRRCLSLLCLMCHNSTNSSSLIKSFFSYAQLAMSCSFHHFHQTTKWKTKIRTKDENENRIIKKKRRNAHNKSVYATRELMMMSSSKKAKEKCVPERAPSTDRARVFIFRCSLPLIAHREERSTLGELTLCLMPWSFFFSFFSLGNLCVSFYI